MPLILKKPIVFFDLETTGVDITHDRIVEISLIKVMPNGEETERTRRVNPGIPIPAPQRPFTASPTRMLPTSQCSGRLPSRLPTS